MFNNISYPQNSSVITIPKYKMYVRIQINFYTIMIQPITKAKIV